LDVKSIMRAILSMLMMPKRQGAAGMMPSGSDVPFARGWIVHSVRIHRLGMTYDLMETAGGWVFTTSMDSL
jgi:hypothetical protein